MLQLGIGVEAGAKVLAGGASGMSVMLCDLSGSSGCDVGLVAELASTPSQKYWSLRLCKKAGHRTLRKHVMMLTTFIETVHSRAWDVDE